MKKKLFLFCFCLYFVCFFVCEKTFSENCDQRQQLLEDLKELKKKDEKLKHHEFAISELKKKIQNNEEEETEKNNDGKGGRTGGKKKKRHRKNR